MSSSTPPPLYLKRSDADHIFALTGYLRPAHYSLDDMEGFFNSLGLEREVVVLNDEDTKEETRPLLVEDAVQQYMKKATADRRNLAAFTDVVNPFYPSYLSVNREANGKVVWTAREAGHHGTKVVNIEMPAEELAKFAEDLYRNTRT
jgi:hypothetical protein